MPNCFIYGDNDGLWAILEKQLYSYNRHGYTWYCECTVDKQKNIYLFDIKTFEDTLYTIKKSLLSLIHFFPGFANFKVRMIQEAKLETGEIKQIPIVMNMQEFIAALTKQNQMKYDDNKKQYVQLYPTGDIKYETPSISKIKFVM